MPVVTGLKATGRKLDPQGGLNFKWGLTSDMVLDSTYNPDFSQIEADMPQIDVNQRYALYYPEKRPFFLEGKDYFDTPFELVYTRTIVDPQWGVKLTRQEQGNDHRPPQFHGHEFARDHDLPIPASTRKKRKLKDLSITPWSTSSV